MVHCDDLVRVILHQHIVARFMGEYVTEQFCAQITAQIAVICKRARPFLLILGMTWGPIMSAGAQSLLPLVTGEYPPYAGQGLPNGGMSTVLIKAVFKTAGFAEPTIDWHPWQRGRAAAKAGRYAASYPYSYNPERGEDLLYSEPLHAYSRAFFTRKKFSDAIEGRWNGLTLCTPLGWDTSAFSHIPKDFNITVVRPASMELCLRMVKRGRADLVFDDALAMTQRMKNIFGKADALVRSKYGQQDGLLFFFVVSRAWPNAKEILKKFNTSLATLRANGEYDRLMTHYVKENMQ